MNDERTGITALMWISYLAMIWFMLEPLGAWVILLAFVLMMPLMGAMGMMWSMGGKSNKHSEKARVADAKNQEKRKRERLDSVLRDLSNEELERLTQRLEERDMTDDILYNQPVGDDGELVDGY